MYTSICEYIFRKRDMITYIYIYIYVWTAASVSCDIRPRATCISHKVLLKGF